MSEPQRHIEILGCRVPATFEAYNANKRTVETVPTGSVQAIEYENGLQLDIDGYIGGWGYWKNGLKRRIKAAQPTEIRLVIDSPGGSFPDALAFNDFLSMYCAENDATLSVRYTGMPASAATFLGSCSQDRAISINASALIHQVSTVAWGNAARMIKSQRELQLFDETLLNLYARDISRNRADREAIWAQMQSDEFMAAETFVALGLADRTFDPATESGAPNYIEQTESSTNLNFLNMKNEKKTEEISVQVKPENKSLFQKIANLLGGSDDDENGNTENAALKNELADLKAQVAEREANAQAAETAKLKAERDKLKNAKENRELEAEIANLKAELAKPFAPGPAPDVSNSADGLENCACGGKTENADADDLTDKTLETLNLD